MKPVFQDQFEFGKGNCVAACIASIFERDLNEFRNFKPYAQDIMEWTKREFPELTYNNVDLAQNYRIVYGYPDCPGVGSGRWTYDLPEEWEPPAIDGYWLASIQSPGLKRPVEDPYYPMPALHMVVMEGKEVLHDPHPGYPVGSYRPQVVMLNWWSEAVPGSSN